MSQDRTLRRRTLNGSGLLPLSALAVSLFLQTGCADPRKEPSPSLARNQLEVPEDAGYLHFHAEFMDRATREALTFDPAAGRPATISYKLTRDTRARVRVVWKADRQLVLRTVQEWTAQKYGVYNVLWDGRDASGNIVDNRRCFITFEEHTRRHAGHDTVRCREPEVKISLPGGPDARIRDLSEIRVSVAKGGFPPSEGGYLLRGYMDYVRVFEVPIPPGRPFSLPSVAAVAPGDHLITLNVDDGFDHTGVAGVRVRIQP